MSVNEKALIHTQGECDALITACSPVIATRVNEYLAMTEGPDAMMIAAWRKFGRSDRTRTVTIALGAVARQTVSPMGIACLLAYARAWLDECQVRVAEERALQAKRGTSKDAPV